MSSFLFRVPAVFLLFASLLLPLSLRGAEKEWRVSLQWRLQSQFAGYIMAEHDGIYRKNGLNVKLIFYNTEGSYLSDLEAGKIDFVNCFLAEGVAAAAEGQDIRHAGQLCQSSALMFTARKSSGIRSMSDLAGRRVGVWYASPVRKMMTRFLENNGAVRCEIFPVAYSPVLFLYGGVDAVSATMYNEYFQIICSGIEPEELVNFELKKYFPGLADDALFARGDTLKNHADTAKKLVRCTLEGWEIAFRDKERTVEIITGMMHKQGLQSNRSHERWMLDRMEEIVFPNGKRHRGELGKQSFDAAMSAMGIRPEKLDFAAFAPLGAEGNDATEAPR